jgi:uncharacterized protein
LRKTQHIKLFSHNDLDGFGAPCLFYALAPYMFKGVEFDLTTCSAGNLDRELEHWFKEPDILRYTDVYIMDMTPDSDYSFKLLEQKFANHWLIFDHHESEAELRSGYSKNCILPLDENVTPSAVSLVWDFMTRQPNFALVPKQKQQELAELVEMIRAYDTWDFQNDKNMSYEERKAADELNQLFWFFPLSKSKSFVDSVFASGWEKYRIEHELLISTLEGRRQRYLDKHLKNVETFEIEGHGFGVVYASDYKSEIAHELLKKYDVDAALVIDSHSVSLRSNGRLDVAKFAEDYFRGGGHADSAGGRLEVEPIKAAEQAVIESVKQRAKLNEEVASQNEDETSSLGDSLDPEMAAKLASLFGNDGK